MAPNTNIVRSSILATFKVCIHEGNALILIDRMITEEDNITPHHLTEDTYFLMEEYSTHLDTYLGDWVYSHTINLMCKLNDVIIEHVELVHEYPTFRIEASLDEIQDAINDRKQAFSLDDDSIPY